MAVVFMARLYHIAPPASIPQDRGCNSISRNVHQVFGWNDSVIDYMKFVLEMK